MTGTDTQAPPEVTAISPDGRRFQFAGSRESPFEPGTLVTLSVSNAAPQVGQVYDVTFSVTGSLTGAGQVLGVISADRRIDNRRSVAFTTATMTLADADTIELLYANSPATVRVGSFVASTDIAARLLPHRFNRHTFWCGQSGSGKTYALGVIIEQLLVHTTLPMVIFDPNADFIRLREPSTVGGGSPEDADEQRSVTERDVRILRPSAPTPDSLRVRFTELTLQAKGAVLHLDPLDDRAEFNELLHLEETVGSLDPHQIVPRLIERGTSAARALAARLENLMVIEWDVWARGLGAVTDVIETRPDATVLDLGGFTYPDEPLVVALAVLDDLWAKRAERRPVLIVIDEAHNLCSPDNTTPLHTAVRERLIQIAAEGRKFGLWLLLSTQRPSRVHPSIISQCDNLALMKMNSPVDLDQLATIFGFVPPAMLARSPGFRQGEALFAGGFVPAPTMIQMRNRLTREGGADVSVPIRAT